MKIDIKNRVMRQELVYSAWYARITDEGLYDFLHTKAKLIYLKYKFDLSSLIREYAINEKLPMHYLHSYISDNTIKNMRNKMNKFRIGKINNGKNADDRINHSDDGEFPDPGAG